MTRTNTNFSGRMLLRMVILGTIVLVLLVANVKYIDQLYFTHQLTTAGFIINGGILVVFLLGITKIISSLMRYMNEEAAVDKLVAHLQSGSERPLKGVSPRSIIAERYNTLSGLSDLHAKINHSALAATLLASESTRTSFAKYISNILILTGVFGTIVSLSIALAGASNLLEDIQGSSNMGLVIHGMSTALSTTITAILCYLFYGYFYLKLGDAQSHILSKVEEATTVYLLPRFSHDSESLMYEVTSLVSSLREAASGLKEMQNEFGVAALRIHETVNSLAALLSHSADDTQDIKRLLREGFRLPPGDV